MNSIFQNPECNSERAIVIMDGVREVEGTIDRRRLQMTTSFMVSLCVHLSLMLAFSSVWVIGRKAPSILLKADSERSVSLDDLSIQIELPQIADPLETDEVVLSDFELNVDEPVSGDPFKSLQTEQVNLEAGDRTMLSEPQKSAGAQSSSGGSFFGIRSKGDKIVYIIDRSASMHVGKYQTRYARAVNELLASVDQLREDQEFHVILFSFDTLRLRMGVNSAFCSATAKNKEKLKRRLYSMRLSPGTDPREALVAALKSNPSCIYLLTDGEFNGEINRNGVYKDKVNTWQLSVKHNKNKCPIHTIGLEDPRTQEQLTRIAESSGGTYVFVPSED